MALSFSPSTDPDSINSRLRRLMSRKRIRSKKQEKGRAVPLDSPAPTTPIVALAKRHDPCSFRTRLSDAGLAPELGYYTANCLATTTTTTTTTPKAFNGCVAVERSLGRPGEALPTPLRATFRVSSRTLRSRKRSRQKDDDGYTPSTSTKVITIPSSILIVPSDEDGSESFAATPLSPGFGLADVAFSTLEEFEDTEMVSWDDRRRDSGPINFDANMSTMRMPFSYQHTRGVRRSAVDMLVATDSTGFGSDEWSVIADASMIPTYGPSDVMKQPIHQAIVRSFVSRCRAAKRRMMMTSRRHSCRLSLTDMTAGQRVSVGAVH